jgi:hypothetical protein
MEGLPQEVIRTKLRDMIRGNDTDLIVAFREMYDLVTHKMCMDAIGADPQNIHNIPPEIWNSVMVKYAILKTKSMSSILTRDIVLFIIENIPVNELRYSARIAMDPNILRSIYDESDSPIREKLLDFIVYNRCELFEKDPDLLLDIVVKSSCPKYYMMHRIKDRVTLFRLMSAGVTIEDAIEYLTVWGMDISESCFSAMLDFYDGIPIQDMRRNFNAVLTNLDIDALNMLLTLVDRDNDHVRVADILPCLFTIYDGDKYKALLDFVDRDGNFITINDLLAVLPNMCYETLKVALTHVDKNGNSIQAKDINVYKTCLDCKDMDQIKLILNFVDKECDAQDIIKSAAHAIYSGELEILNLFIDATPRETDKKALILKVIQRCKKINGGPIPVQVVTYFMDCCGAAPE